MFSGFTPIIGYELKPVFITTTSDRVSVVLYIYIIVYISRNKLIIYLGPV